MAWYSWHIIDMINYHPEVWAYFNQRPGHELATSILCVCVCGVYGMCGCVSVYACVRAGGWVFTRKRVPL